MISKLKILFLIFLISIILESCKDNNSINLSDYQYLDLLELSFPANFFSMINDSSGNFTDDIQSIRFLESTAVNDTTYKNGYSYQIAAIAFYKNGDLTRQISSVACENQNLIYQSNALYPVYLYKWQENTGPTFGTKVSWIINNDGETVTDTILAPNGFNNLSFSTYGINLDSGGTITWSDTSSGKVNINILWVTDSSNINTAHFKVVPDNGICVIKSSELKALQMPANVVTLNFDMQKGNIKHKVYAKGTKQISTISYVERRLNVNVKK